MKTLKLKILLPATLSLFLCASCERSEVQLPIIGIEWPAKYADLDTSIPITISNLQGSVEWSYLDPRYSSPGLHAANCYLWKENRHDLYGSVSYLLDSRQIDVKRVFIGTQLPLQTEEPKNTDFTVTRLTKQGTWTVFDLKKK